MSNAPTRRVLFGSPWWHSDIVNGVLRHAARLGWHVDLQTLLSGRLPDEWDGDGIITQLGSDLDEQRAFLDRTRCPAVSLNANFPQIDIPRVSTNSAAAGRLAAEHLLERGFQHFAFYAYDLSSRTFARHAAYKQALQHAGYEPYTIAWADEQQHYDSTWPQRIAWLRQRLADLPQPLAVYAFNDQAAVEVIEACLAESIPVPERVAVLGTLNMDLFRHSTTIGLSSIDFDFDDMTRRACQLLHDMMQGSPPPDDPILVPPVRVVVRQSTDIVAAHTPLVARAIRFMLDHYHQPIGIDDIRQAVGGSRARLFNAFKNDMNRTPGDVLTRIRLDHAKRLLTDTDDKVYAIAAACGFGKPLNLHRAFKQQTGQSPNAYRKQQRTRASRPADQPTTRA